METNRIIRNIEFPVDLPMIIHFFVDHRDKYYVLA